MDVRLTKAQAQVLKELVETNDTVKEIAFRLNVAPKTISAHVLAICESYEVHSRHELLRKIWNNPVVNVIQSRDPVADILNRIEDKLDAILKALS